MTSRVYSKRFYGPSSAIVTTGIECFTVPAGHVYVVRYISASNNSTTAENRFRGHIGPTSSAIYRVVGLEVPPQTTGAKDVRLVMTAGEKFMRSQTTIEAMIVSIHGWDLLE